METLTFVIMMRGVTTRKIKALEEFNSAWEEEDFGVALRAEYEYWDEVKKAIENENDN